VRKKLRKARKAKGLSVPKLSALLGISSSFYYKIEQGMRNPTIALAKVLADFLDSTVEELFFSTELDEPSSTEASATGAEGR
jgi:transcriptional regulator with XRE-family HTH domain